jgi:Zn-dependent peptidase ImmA (M78 family)
LVGEDAGYAHSVAGYTDTGYTSWSTEREIAEEFGREATEDADADAEQAYHDEEDEQNDAGWRGRVVILRVRIADVRDQMEPGEEREDEWRLGGAWRGSRSARGGRMTKSRSWLAALNEAAESQGLRMPRFNFTVGGMGAATSELVGDRFVTLKHRLDIHQTPVPKWVQWSLWRTDQDQPGFIGSFKTPTEATPVDVSLAFPLLRGWLFEQWSPEKALEEVRKHPRSLEIEMPPRSGAQPREYWISEDREFGFIVGIDSWTIVSSDETQELDRALLKTFCEWLAMFWHAIAFGGDIRPPAILEEPVSAPKAYGDAQINQPEMEEWWRRHAARAADPGLPNVFFERQADDLVVSSGEHVYVLQAAVAVPALRSLVESHCGIGRERAKALLRQPYQAINRYSSAATRDWLKQYQFTDSDARELAETGVSSHPIVGLLRSGQGSSLATPDYETAFKVLKRSGPNSYEAILAMAKGLDKRINPREPWGSGYELAKQVRRRLGIAPSAKLDVETWAHELGVDVQEAVFQDERILGVCVGTPAHMPLVVLNRSCADANGPSGRRMTLSHELCHLLFDRGAYRHLARFEGARAVGDRLIEMRANAFAIELLVPMVNLSGLTEDVLGDFAHEWEVSTHALVRHLSNYRARGGP